jgi:peptide/nickel transport system ATP-binding protein
MEPVEISDLSVALTVGGSEIVRDVSMRVDSGEIMGVVGESGSGKSTLALALLGFARSGARITGGTVSVDGTDLLTLPPRLLRKARRELVAYVPQDPAASLNPAMKIGAQLAESVPEFTGDIETELDSLLESVGLPAGTRFRRRRPTELSGGQQQGVAIAMAVARRPRMIVLDEPTTGLDVSTQTMVLDLVKRLCSESSMSTVYISHDLAVVSTISHRVTVMYGGRVVETGSVGDVVHHSAHPYSRALLNSVPSARERRTLVPIPGRAPAVGDYGDGCVFAPRCAHAVDECRRAEPLLERVSGAHQVRCIRSGTAPAELTGPATSTPRAVARDHENTVLSVSSLNADYGSRRVLSEVSFTLSAGECLAVVGESGSGKTTPSRCVIGLHAQQEASLTLDGAEIPLHVGDRTKETKRRIQYIFQNPYGSLNPRHTISASIERALRHFFGLRGRAARARVREVLDRVEIPEAVADRYPAELSGGQRQRVAIARALACDPDVLLCDEVTSALDVSVQASVVELLRSLCADGLSSLFVTHDLGVVRSIADSVLVLNEGRVMEIGPSESLLRAPEHAYTRKLLADTPEIVAPRTEVPTVCTQRQHLLTTEQESS